MAWSKRQKIVLAFLSVGHLCDGFCTSVQAPFFPTTATSKGLSSTVVGLVFGIYKLSEFITAPILGKYIEQIGPKFLTVSGMFVTGTTCVLFGFLDMINDKVTFTAFAFMIRIVEGVGDAAYITGANSIATKEFPDNLQAAVSIYQAAYAFGFATGPALGGVIHETGGFVSSFALIGVLILISGFAIAVLLPDTHYEGTKKVGSILGLFKDFGVIVFLFTVFVVMANMGFIDVTLGLFLQQFHLTPSNIGLIFLLLGRVRWLNPTHMGIRG